MALDSVLSEERDPKIADIIEYCSKFVSVCGSGGFDVFF
jgi:hypothetical protein